MTCDRSAVSPGTPVSSTNKADHEEIDEILLKVALNTITITSYFPGHVEWKDLKTKKQCLLMWRTPEEWGNLIYSWVYNINFLSRVSDIMRVII